MKRKVKILAILATFSILALAACAGANKNSSVLPSAPSSASADNNYHPRRTKSAGDFALYAAYPNALGTVGKVAAFGLFGTYVEQPQFYSVGGGTFPNIKDLCAMTTDPNTGNLYVVDCGTNNIKAYSMFGYQVTLTPVTSETPFAPPFPNEKPTSITWGPPAVFPGGGAYVAWSGTNYANALASYFPDGTLSRSVGVDGTPTALAFDYVTNYFFYALNGKIQEVDGNLNPVYLNNSAFSNVKSAVGIATDPGNGNVCIEDAGANGVVDVYNDTGATLVGSMQVPNYQQFGPIACINGTVYVTGYNSTGPPAPVDAFTEQGQAVVLGQAFTPNQYTAFAYGPYGGSTPAIRILH